MKRLFVILLLASGTLANAQHLVNSHTNLDSLSNEYLKVGDNYCLVIDALEDGFIKADASYDIEFNHNVLTVNGQTASTEMSTRYLGKIRQLNKYRGLPDNDHYNFASLNGTGGISMNTPQPYVSAEAREERRQKRYYTCTQFVDKLLADKIIYSREVSIHHTIDGIWINDRKLSIKQERKYIPLLAQVVALDKIDSATPAFAASETNHDGFIRLTGY